ncbi:hypothetical protein BRADI_4g12899v3 [Brachypodium distachyon]|uniref:BPM/SPOP BACK domain-containing protein n=1 Tax=Brachypodium distachyon TaxID=15368 RepID=A0A0Q3H2N7_BRADI|nr:hypothetical protein BRADI_4g12899v3 [Brachypodium distachyon]
MEERTASHVQIDDDHMEATVFKALLQFIYTDPLPEMEEGNIAAMAQHLLLSVHYFGAGGTTWMCRDKKKACFKFLASPGNLKDVMASEGLEHLRSSCPSILVELLANLAL